jgi:hypothetical protein
MLHSLVLLRSSLTAACVLALSCGAEPTPAARGAAQAQAARVLVRPYLAGNALSRPVPATTAHGVSPGPRAVVLAHQAPDGTIRVGCVDSEDGAADLVQSAEDTR